MYIWIRRLIFRIRIWIAIWRLKEKELTVNLDLINTLIRVPAMELLDEYTPAVGHSITLNVSFRNVNDHISTLSTYIDAIKNKEYIRDSLLARSANRSEIRLDDFLVAGNKDYPIHPREFYPILHDLINELTIALKSVEEDKVWSAYFKRRSDNVIKDTYYVLEALLKAAYK